MTNTLPFGVVPDLPNHEYQADPGISKGKLDKIAACPAVYWNEYINPDRGPREMTPELILGDACHDAILQPDLFRQKWLTLPPLNLRTNAGRAERDAFIAEHPGASILSVDDYATALAVRDAVYRHPTASKLLTGGLAELSWFGVDPDTGARIKCRTETTASAPWWTSSPQRTQAPTDSPRASPTSAITSKKAGTTTCWARWMPSCRAGSGSPSRRRRPT